VLTEDVSRSPQPGSKEDNVPKVHAVDEGRARVGPPAPVGEVGDVPHELVHDLRQPDGVGRRARATTVRTGTLAVGNVRLVVRSVKVPAVPAAAR
jgi:hypothetical protein